jgi:hypothetical protein
MILGMDAVSENGKRMPTISTFCTATAWTG